MSANRNRRRTKKASLPQRIICLTQFLNQKPHPFVVVKKYLKGEEPIKTQQTA